MTETVTRCDRCGQVRRDPYGMPDGEGCRLSPFGGVFFLDLHLCRRCTHAFKAWLEAGSRPDDPDPEETAPGVKAAPWSDRPRRGRRKAR
jgi:hypothetical protein